MGGKLYFGCVMGCLAFGHWSMNTQQTKEKSTKTKSEEALEAIELHRGNSGKLVAAPCRGNCSYNLCCSLFEVPRQFGKFVAAHRRPTPKWKFLAGVFLSSFVGYVSMYVNSIY